MRTCKQIKGIGLERELPFKLLLLLTFELSENEQAFLQLDQFMTYSSAGQGKNLPTVSVRNLRL